MSILSPSESVSFNSFLAAVDHHDHLEFEGLAEKIHITHGRDALAKATKDLMAMGSLAHSTSSSKSGTQGKSPAGSSITNRTGSSSRWPSFSPEASSSSSSGDARPHSFAGPFPALDHRHASQDPFMPRPHSTQQQIPSIRSLEKIMSPPLSNATDVPRRTSLPTSVSAPSVSISTSSKRSLPEDDSHTGSSAPKRPRPSHSPTEPNTRSRRQSSAGSNVNRARTSGAGTATTNKPALLSPSQKRANHIQSEQKRRANIRRGYDALCNAVPALREAIAAEDAQVAAGTEDGSSVGGVKGRKRKKKSEESIVDGRAGPKSENVVLQKTIEHITSLIDDRESLLTRLQSARSSLAQGHPALVVSDAHKNADGVPLWEREWNGGVGIVEEGVEEGEEDDGEGGSEDEG
ncbi:uncharacterized protein LAESUDRAFT_730103 [Laetiporus sulphureus 93-53]|uniref:BHLH domain-containing protein n=1 Tax=Laetiporus sulphureus 93-53 TaxID=1314785 RepID=A0A165CD36_9APHY|nr:uncharacterized protein LAESUDRAFT_730103 [Laetiporus sulphureus 93-53]KZT02594.1 hypothetical protein LAESUDRAFT_730103 [Laetiporus sulphureus 93-53]